MIENLPIGIQKKLLTVADHLPKDCRNRFLRAARREITTAVREYPRTMAFPVLGWLLGELIDRKVAFQLPFTQTVIVPTLGRASEVLAAVGLYKGFTEDRASFARRSEINRAVKRAIREATGGVR